MNRLEELRSDIKNDFAWIEFVYPDVYENIDLALKHESNLDILAFKLRKALENLIKKIAEKESIDATKTLHENVKILSSFNILPNDVVVLCDNIRMIGNTGVHTDNITVKEVEDTIDCFYKLLMWINYRYDLKRSYYRSKQDVEKVDKSNCNKECMDNQSGKIKLSKEQAETFKIIEENNDNYFVTGAAGTGKSVVLRYFLENSHKKIAVTAPTGIAALNIAGQTLHSFFGLEPALQE